MEELIPIFPNLFQKFEDHGMIPNSFYEDFIILITEAEKDTIRKENYRLISLMNRDAKTLNKVLMLVNWIHSTLKGLYTMAKQVYP